MRADRNTYTDISRPDTTYVRRVCVCVCLCGLLRHGAMMEGVVRLDVVTL